MGRYVTSVASVVYNMAGDIDLRPDVVKGVILGEVLGKEKPDLAKAMSDAFTDGVAMGQRNFFRWASNNLDDGIPIGSLGSSVSVDQSAVESGLRTLLGSATNETLRIEEAYVDDADPEYWAEDWARRNRPDLTPNDWVVSYDPATYELVLDFLEGTPEERIPASADFLWSIQEPGKRNLLFVTYTVITEDGDSVSAGPVTLTVYRIGSGNVALDGLGSSTADSMGEFFPPLPLRIENKAIDHTDYSADFPNISRAYKKLTGRKIDDVLTSLEENEDIADIDHAFIIPGVTLNTKDDAAKEYLFRFFSHLNDVQPMSKATFKNHVTSMFDRGALQATWDRWYVGQGVAENPTNGWVQPAVPPAFGSPDKGQLRIYSPNRPEFDLRLHWNYINETLHVGNCKTFDGVTRELAKKGTYWAAKGTPQGMSFDVPGSAITDRLLRDYQEDVFYLFHQTDQYKYRRLEISGLLHKNYVYGSHAVHMTSDQAMDDPEESGFLIPLHYPTLKSMSLPRATQLSTANTYLLLNCYHRRKKKWYERGIFKVILVVVSVAISIATAGGSLAAAGGILGTNAAVGSAILGVGVATTTAAIVGAIANYAAAMIISTVVMKASTTLLGDKLGAIVGTIATFFAMQVGAAYFETGSFTVDWGEIMQSQNLMSLTNNVSQAYSLWLGADTAEIYSSMESLRDEHNDKLEELEELANDVLGMTNGSFNPIMLTDIPETLGESSETFINRTLLTGDDIVELTHRLIDNFSELSLRLPDMPR